MCSVFVLLFLADDWHLFIQKFICHLFITHFRFYSNKWFSIGFSQSFFLIQSEISGVENFLYFKTKKFDRIATVLRNLNVSTRTVQQWWLESTQIVIIYIDKLKELNLRLGTVKQEHLQIKYWSKWIGEYEFSTCLVFFQNSFQTEYSVDELNHWTKTSKDWFVLWSFHSRTSHSIIFNYVIFCYFDLNSHTHLNDAVNHSHPTWVFNCCHQCVFVFLFYRDFVPLSFA